LDIEGFFGFAFAHVGSPGTGGREVGGPGGRPRIAYFAAWDAHSGNPA
jgi:hypothetical protein